MCLIVFAWKLIPQCPLVMAANRDEFFERPTQPASWWEDAPNIYAGRDLQAGGTWLGTDKRGRFAALTNIRDGSAGRTEARSRGELVANYLRGDLEAAEYLQTLREQRPTTTDSIYSWVMQHRRTGFRITLPSQSVPSSRVSTGYPTANWIRPGPRSCVQRRSLPACFVRPPPMMPTSKCSLTPRRPTTADCQIPGLASNGKGCSHPFVLNHQRTARERQRSCVYTPAVILSSWKKSFVNVNSAQLEAHAPVGNTGLHEFFALAHKAVTFIKAPGM
jgi:hypothetical protein